MSNVRGHLEHLLYLAAFFWFWRTAVVLAGALAVAVALASHFSWFTGEHGLWLVLVAFGGGLVWEGSKHSGRGLDTAPPVKLSAPVAALSLAFFGAVAGGWASAAVGSFVTGGISLVAGAAAVGVYSARSNKQPFSWKSFVYAAAMLLLGMGCLAGFGALVTGATSNPSIERTSSSKLRLLPVAAHVER